VTERTGLSDIVFKTMPAAYVAAKQTYLTKDDANEINKFAWMTQKHNELLKLSPQEAVVRFTRLDPSIQEAMKQLFETNYGDISQEPSKLFTKIKSGLARPTGGLFEGLRDYTETVISNPFRQADAALRQTGDNWDDTYNGEAYFDRERAASVEDYYGSTVSKIAKLLASGKRPGEILLMLETDEEFDAFERMINGDEEFDRAVSEFDDAKVSFGRRMFGFLQPGAGTHGARRWLYDRASGAGDLAYQIFADPLTYATLGVGTGVRLFGKTLIEGNRSLIGLLNKVDNTDEYFTKLDAIFKVRGVSEYWDRLGPLVNELGSKSAVSRVAASNKIKEIFPEVSDEFKELLRKGDVKDSATAKKFFQEAKNVHNLMNGVGLSKLQRTVMPTWKTTRNIKSKLRTATLAAIRGNTDELAEIGTIEKIVSDANKLSRLETRDYALLDEGSDLVKATKERRGALGKVERLASRYPIMPTVEIGADYAKSSELVFQMARTYLPRWHANGVRTQWEQNDPYGRFLMLRGIYIQMAQSVGLTDSLEGREFLARQLETQFGGQYAVKVFYKTDVLRALEKGLTSSVDSIVRNGGNYQAGDIGGAAVAANWWQARSVIANIDLAEWQRMANDINSKLPFAADGTFVSSVLDEVNNHWTLFTLYPRNGMRSSIEELIFYGLEGSIRDLLTYFKARGISRARRRTLAPEEQTLTAKLGMMSAKNSMYSNAELQQALADKSGKSFGELQVKNAVGEINRSLGNRFLSLFGINRIAGQNTEKHIRAFYEFGHARNMGTDVISANIQSGQQMRRGYRAPSPANQESNYGFAEKVSYNNDAIYAEQLGVKPEKGFKRDGKIVRSKTAQLKGIPAPSVSDTFGLRPFIATWHGSLQSVINVDRVGARIILDNINNPAVAEEKLVKYYKSNKQIETALESSVAFRETAEKIDKEIAYSQMATNHYLTLRNNVTDAGDEVIDEVVAKVYNPAGNTTDEVFSYLDNFYPDELLDVTVRTNRTPKEVHGYQYILAEEDPSNIAAKLAMLEEKGYNFMQRQIDMTAREPILIARYMANRQELDKAELAEVRRLVNSGYSEKVAQNIADERFSNIAYNNAMERTIAYMDNPRVRSHLAFHVRNFARFYRATEDFYRRSARLGINNPQSLIRLRLGLVGLDASGFIHKDEEGEDYFIYPADDIIYQAVNAFSKAFGRQEALEVMPVEFTSKISMFTPSLDPDSSIPAFNGPVSALPVSAIRFIMGKTDMVPGDIEAAFNRYTMGVYSENSTLLDMLVPTTVRKALNILSAASGDEANKQVQSAFMSAAAYNSAAGLAPDDADDFMELQKKKAQLLVTASNIITIRNIVGFFAPASIQMEEIKDLPDYVLRTGTTRLSSEYYTIVNGLAEQGSADPWGEGLAIFTRKNPGRLAYTIPRSENTGLIKINKTKEAADWVRENRTFISKYGTTGVLFAPQIGEFDINAYSYLRNQGFTQSRDLEEFLREISTKKARREYDTIRDSWDSKIRSTTIESIKSFYRSQKSDQLRMFKNSNPLLREQMEQFEFSTYSQQTGIEELRDMLNAGEAPNAAMAKKLRLMLAAYDSARAAWTIGTGGELLSPEQVRSIRQDVVAQLERIAGNDPALNLAIDKLFAPVLERSR
jgi:hypothetical protein